MRKLAGVLAAAFIVSAVAGSPSAQTQEFAFGLIRPDGILTPVAVFDGTKWVPAWPEPKDDMVLGGMIESLPSYWRERGRQAPVAWHVMRRGQNPVKVSVLEHIVFTEQCGNQVGLLTDLRPRRVVDAMPYARMLATDRLIPVDVPPFTPPKPVMRGENTRRTIRPLGVLNAGRSTYRVVLEIGYESEVVAVIQVGPDGDREVLCKFIGGC